MANALKAQKKQHSSESESVCALSVPAGDLQRDLSAEIRSDRSDDADAAQLAQSYFGNLRQNPTTHWKVQQR